MEKKSLNNKINSIFFIEISYQMTKSIRQRTTMVCYRIWKNVG